MRKLLCCPSFSLARIAMSPIGKQFLSDDSLHLMQFFSACACCRCSYQNKMDDVIVTASTSDSQVSGLTVAGTSSQRTVSLTVTATDVSHDPAPGALHPVM